MLKFMAVDGRPGKNCMGHLFVDLIEILRELQGCAPIKLLTCDLEIVLGLYYTPNRAAGELFRCSCHSSTAFYAALKRLGQAGIIIAEPDPNDRRSNVYHLGPEIHNEIRSRLSPDSLV